MNDDLVQFLRNRLTDDERQAKAAMTYAAKDWFIETSGIVTTGPKDDVYTNDREVAEHIARHDPARVLHDVEAKREVIRLAEAAHDYHETFMSGFAAEMEKALRLFAVSYVDHPEYRDEWRPTPRPRSIVDETGPKL